MELAISKNYSTQPGRKFLLRAHVIFVVKFRKKLLKGTLDEKIKHYFLTLATTKFEILLLETDLDHVHFLIDYDPTMSVSSIVRRLKQMSTHWIWQNFDLRNHFWKENTFWSDGYFAASVRGRGFH
jgi:putative transposase